MGRFVKGDVVVVPFPFSDLSDSKRRPALVVTQLSGDDVILCMITSTRSDGYSVPLSRHDFDTGGLKHDSHIRPNRLFTADSNTVVYSPGKLTMSKTKEVIEKIVEIVRA